MIQPFLGERAIRIWAGIEAIELGRGGETAVSEATKLSRNTVSQGILEVEKLRSGLAHMVLPSNEIRKKGGGRKPITETQPGVDKALDSLIEPTTRGDPESSLRWTCKSTPNLTKELNQLGFQVSERTVYKMLSQQNYSLQSNQKTREGKSHPDRNEQFHFISDSVAQFQKEGQPTISVDTKKKEVIGNYKNNGREWRPIGAPREVNMHDFPNPEFGKVAPYGVYDLEQNNGLVNVGINHDTAEFAVESIRRWWDEMGKETYPDAKRLLITADGGGSNGSRVRLWKKSLQQLANETNLELHVRHFPPGTSKWNKIEHRMFCHISKNWRGRPLESREIVINLIGSTTTKTGLKIKAMLDENNYEIGEKVSNEELLSLALQQKQFHGEWNYSIQPQPKPNRSDY